jgi:hypothetical protein
VKVLRGLGIDIATRDGGLVLQELDAWQLRDLVLERRTVVALAIVEVGNMASWNLGCAITFSKMRSGVEADLYRPGPAYRST